MESLSLRGLSERETGRGVQHAAVWKNKRKLNQSSRETNCAGVKICV